jgi:hypothetical protein
MIELLFVCIAARAAAAAQCRGFRFFAKLHYVHARLQNSVGIEQGWRRFFFLVLPMEYSFRSTNWWKVTAPVRHRQF